MWLRAAPGTAGGAAGGSYGGVRFAGALELQLGGWQKRAILLNRATLLLRTHKLDQASGASLQGPTDTH